MGRTVTPNKQAILALTVSEGKDRERISVKGIDGLVIDVTKRGPQSFYLRYRKDGKNHWRNLGPVNALLRDGSTVAVGGEEVTRLAQIVATARRDMAAVKVEGRDLVDDKTSKLTFDDLFKMWVEAYAKPTRKSWESDVERYERHYKERIGNIVVSQHRRSDYAKALDDVVIKISRTEARFMRELIGGVLRWAEDREHCQHVARAIKLAGRKEKPRRRPWLPHELRPFWRALDEMGDARTALALKLIVLTGKRLSEVCEAKKSELRMDGPDPQWIIPDSRMKNDDEHRVPLAPLALSLFRQVCADSTNEYVFPSRAGSEQPHIDPLAVTRQRKRIIDKLGIVGVTTHDFRTTISTETRHMKVATDVRRGLLSHKPKPDDLIDSTYGIGDPWHERRAALEAWERRVLEIASGA